MNRTGHQTHDLRLHQRHHDPIAAEARTRRFGRVCLIGGLALLVVVYFGGLSAAIVSDNNTFQSPSGRLFAVLGMMALIGLGCTLTSLGGVVHINRPYREGLDRNRLLLERLTIDVDERLRGLIGAVEALSGRMVALENAQQALIEVLPAEIQRRYWAGFSDAVREGYAETGTDGAGRPRQPRLGLVQPTESPGGNGA